MSMPEISPPRGGPALVEGFTPAFRIAPDAEASRFVGGPPPVGQPDLDAPRPDVVVKWTDLTDPAEHVATVNGQVGAWEVGSVGLYDDLPFELPPLGAETAELDDSLETAMPIDPAGPVAIKGSLDTSDHVDYFKIDHTEGIYLLAFGNTEPSARGGQRIVLIDQHGQTIHTLMMPSGKGVVTVDLRPLQPAGEPLYVGISRGLESENASAGASMKSDAGSDSPAPVESESYWMFVRTQKRVEEGSGSSWYDNVSSWTSAEFDRGREESERSEETADVPASIIVAASETITASTATGLPTGPLPRLAAGANRGLLASSFVLGRVSPIEGLALDLPAQALEGDSGEPATDGDRNPGPLVAVRGMNLPLLAAANLSTPAPPVAVAENGGGGEEDLQAAADRTKAEVEAKPSRRLPVGLGLATVLAVSLMLPDFAALRPGGFARRRLGLGVGGGGHGPRREVPG